MADWIDYCPSCGMEFDLEAKPRYRREIIKHLDTTKDGWMPKPEAIEVRCIYGHSFDAEAHEYRQGSGVRVKLL